MKRIDEIHSTYKFLYLRLTKDMKFELAVKVNNIK